MFAIVHCTAGDFMIATLSLVAALLLLGVNAWPNARFIPVMITTLILSLSYTFYGEWANTVVHQTWTYSNLMPKSPPLGTGLSPLLQWIIVPALGFKAISHFLPMSHVNSLTQPTWNLLRGDPLIDQAHRIDNF